MYIFVEVQKAMVCSLCTLVMHNIIISFKILASFQHKIIAITNVCGILHNVKKKQMYLCLYEKVIIKKSKQHQIFVTLDFV